MILKMKSATVSNARAKHLTLNILRELLPATHTHKVGIRLWDGSLWPDSHPRATTVVLAHPGSLHAMFCSGDEVGLAEAFVYGDFDIEGRVEDVFELADSITRDSVGWIKRAHAAARLLRLGHASGRRRSVVGAATRRCARLNGKPHSIERDRQAVAYHYNVSNEFFANWLDRQMVYSCAYFETPDDDLDVAQARKLDYICRKLRLQPGQRLLDIGCGWGALMLHAARHYGVDVTGITLSAPQVQFATEQIQQCGLSAHCRVLERDYREMTGIAAYDALVSVGMIEHVGAAQLPIYFGQALRLLRPRGVLLNHGITHSAMHQPTSGRGFIDSYVFPDGELVPISQVLHHAEDTGFEVRDVESLREHYALTLRQWVARLEQAHDRALESVDEPTYRIWRLYMAASAHGFKSGRLNLYQSLLVKCDGRGENDLPLTRADWYGKVDHAG